MVAGLGAALLIIGLAVGMTAVAEQSAAEQPVAEQPAEGQAALENQPVERPPDEEPALEKPPDEEPALEKPPDAKPMEDEDSSESWLSPFTFSMKSTIRSKYVWRGLLLNKDPSYLSSSTLGYGGFSLNLRGNVDLTTINERKYKLGELDTTFGYSHAFDGLIVEGGITNYASFGKAGYPSTTEVYTGLGLDVPLSPGIRAYFDIDKSQGAYYEATIGHTFNLLENVDLKLSTALGYGSARNNNFYYGVNKAAFTNASMTADLPITISEHITISPFITYTTLLDGQITNLKPKAENVIFGITFSYEF